MSTSKVLVFVIGFVVIGITSIDEAYAGGCSCPTNCLYSVEALAIADPSGCALTTYTFTQKSPKFDIIIANVTNGDNAGSTLTINNGTGVDLIINGTFRDEGPNNVVW